MVGAVGGSRRRVAVARTYDDVATTWDTAAGPVYQPLASCLVQASPIALAGKLVLDLGGGTGAVARAATGKGARVVVADCSVGMVAHGHERGWMAVVADALALPVRDRCFDAVVAGFLLNHLPPAAALREMERIVRPGGTVLASTWATVGSDPVKAAIAGVLSSWGWLPPAWYETMKADVEPISGDPRSLGDAAGQAGLVEVHATAVAEDLSRLDLHAVVAYRLAMPQIAPWVARLGERAASDLVRQLCIAIAPHVPGWRPSVIHLTARVPGHPR
jgi:ubiquinone/menaquinone biosynthesis C-methylase UbiE